MFFNEIDTYKNGRITRDQLYAALNKNTLVSEKIKIHFDKNVTNHSSHISFKEFSKILDDLNGKYEEYEEESNEEYVYLDKCDSTAPPRGCAHRPLKPLWGQMRRCPLDLVSTKRDKKTKRKTIVAYF